MTAHDLWLEPDDDDQKACQKDFIELDEPEGDYGGDEEAGDSGSDEHERIINNNY